MKQFFTGLYIEDEKLESFAANSARLMEPGAETDGSAAAALLRRQLAAVRRCHEIVRRRYEEAEELPAACEWLLDNWYLAQQEAQAALSDLRRAKKQRLGAEGLLICSLSRALLRAGQGQLDAERCTAFLRGFQSVTPLRRRELLLFPAAVRAAILEFLAEVCAALPYAADTAPHREALEALFGSLRFLAGADMEELLRGVDLCDAAFAQDPGGVYVRMDRESRQLYLERLEALARAEGTEEQPLARRLVKKAREEGRHLGFYLFDEPKDGGAGYIAAVVLTCLFLSLLLAFAAGSAWLAPLLLLPVSELVKGLIDLILLRSFPARRLPRMDLSEGVPPEGKTLCVLSALLTDEQSAGALCRRLEEFRLAGRGGTCSTGSWPTCPLPTPSRRRRTPPCCAPPARPSPRSIARAEAAFIFSRVRAASTGRAGAARRGNAARFWSWQSSWPTSPPLSPSPEIRTRWRAHAISSRSTATQGCCPERRSR